MSGLIRLVYISRARFKPADETQGVEPTVARILMRSRSNNPQHKIGGVLYYGDGHFFQCLEGPSDVVNNLMAKIMQDSRHTDVEIVKVGPVDERLFKNWSMKYIPVESEVTGLLQRYGKNRFDPYQFQDELVDELVKLFVRLANPQNHSDQNYAPPTQPRPGLWRRLFGWFNQTGPKT